MNKDGEVPLRKCMLTSARIVPPFIVTINHDVGFARSSLLLATLKAAFIKNKLCLLKEFVFELQLVSSISNDGKTQLFDSLADSTQRRFLFYRSLASTFDESWQKRLNFQLLLKSVTNPFPKAFSKLF